MGKTRRICTLAAVGLTLVTPGGAVASQPTAAQASRIEAVIAPLDRERVRDRAALARATSRAGQRQVALRLERAHRAAADALRPVAGATLVARLSDAADAYAGLADATSAMRFAEAAEAVRRADERLTAAVGRRSAIRPVIAPEPSSGTSPGALIAALALLAALGGGAWWRRRRAAEPMAASPEIQRGPWRPRTQATPPRPAPPAPRPPSRAGSDAEQRWDGAPV
jgi:hypothetical protein